MGPRLLERGKSSRLTVRLCIARAHSTRRDEGLLPQPVEIRFNCSCPDYADLCKHQAAVLYGIGARLDTQPELIFQLRGVDPEELITQASTAQLVGSAQPGGLEGDLSEIFGIEIAQENPVVIPESSTPPEAPSLTTLPPPPPPIVVRYESLNLPKPKKKRKKRTIKKIIYYDLATGMSPKILEIKLPVKKKSKRADSK